MRYNVFGRSCDFSSTGVRTGTPFVGTRPVPLRVAIDSERESEGISNSGDKRYGVRKGEAWNSLKYLVMAMIMFIQYTIFESNKFAVDNGRRKDQTLIHRKSEICRRGVNNKQSPKSNSRQNESVRE